MGNILEFRRPRRPRRGLPRLPATLSELRLVLLIGCFLGFGWWELSSERPAWGSTPDALISASFSVCGWGPRVNCVVDGDTFYYRGEKVRIADIDTPETHPPRCPEEAELGARATRRLNELLNAGPFAMVATKERDTDRYGRKLRTVYRDGQSIGEVLVRESLARRYSGGWRAPWCG